MKLEPISSHDLRVRLNAVDRLHAVIDRYVGRHADPDSARRYWRWALAICVLNDKVPSPKLLSKWICGDYFPYDYTCGTAIRRLLQYHGYVYNIRFNKRESDFPLTLEMVIEQSQLDWLIDHSTFAELNGGAVRDTMLMRVIEKLPPPKPIDRKELATSLFRDHVLFRLITREVSTYGTMVSMEISDDTMGASYRRICDYLTRDERVELVREVFNSLHVMEVINTTFSGNDMAVHYRSTFKT